MSLPPSAPASPPATPAPVSPRRPGLALLLVVGIPLSALVSGVTFLAVAGSGGLDRVADEVQRTGRIQQTRLDADLAARAAGLRAEARVEAGRLHLRLHGVDPAALVLRLEHPTQAIHDRTLALTPDGSGSWWAEWPAEAVAWKLVLSPPEGSWRIKARWPRDGHGAVQLEPALQAP